MTVVSSPAVAPRESAPPPPPLPPVRLGPYLLKVAETAEEVEQVHRLNYRTFVREIPQHADQGDGRLVDKFHDRNVYFIAIREGRVVGMVSAHGGPKFS